MRPPQRQDERFQKSSVRIFECRNPPEATQSEVEKTPAPADEAYWDLCRMIVDLQTCQTRRIPKYACAHASAAAFLSIPALNHESLPLCGPGLSASVTAQV